MCSGHRQEILGLNTKSHLLPFLLPFYSFYPHPILPRESNCEAFSIHSIDTLAPEPYLDPIHLLFYLLSPTTMAPRETNNSASALEENMPPARPNQRPESPSANDPTFDPALLRRRRGRLQPRLRPRPPGQRHLPNQRHLPSPEHQRRPPQTQRPPAEARKRQSHSTNQKPPHPPSRRQHHPRRSRATMSSPCVSTQKKTR